MRGCSCDKFGGKPATGDGMGMGWDGSEGRSCPSSPLRGGALRVLSTGYTGQGRQDEATSTRKEATTERRDPLYLATLLIGKDRSRLKNRAE